jgi:hypothetical protein
VFEDLQGGPPQASEADCIDECGSLENCVYASALGEDSESVCNENICEITVPITWASDTANGIICNNNILFGTWCEDYSIDNSTLVITYLNYSECIITTWSPHAS